MRPISGAITARVQKIILLEIIDDGKSVKPCWRPLRPFCLRGLLSVDTIEDFAVLGVLLLFGSLSLGVIVLIY
jgi:hypothetical protein